MKVRKEDAGVYALVADALIETFDNNLKIIQVGNGSVSKIYGKGSSVIVNGDRCTCCIEGEDCCVINNGHHNKIYLMAKGCALTDSGYHSKVKVYAEKCKVICTGDESKIISKSSNNLLINIGDCGRISAAIGCSIIMAEYTYGSGMRVISTIKKDVVDGIYIKEGCHYSLVKGEFYE